MILKAIYEDLSGQSVENHEIGQNVNPQSLSMLSKRPLILLVVKLSPLLSLCIS